jgi:hypothetical protein
MSGPPTFAEQETGWSSPGPSAKDHDRDGVFLQGSTCQVGGSTHICLSSQLGGWCHGPGMQEEVWESGMRHGNTPRMYLVDR